MALINVYDNIKDPVGNPAIGVEILIELISASGISPGVGFASDHSVINGLTVNTDKAGHWEANLESNASLAPSNTYYRISYKRFSAAKYLPPFYIQVPATGGPYLVSTLFVSPLPEVGDLVGGLTGVIRRIASATTSASTTTTVVDPVLTTMNPSGLYVTEAFQAKKVNLKCFIPKAWCVGDTGFVGIFEGSTLVAAGEVNSSTARELLVEREFTPSAGAHTYEVKVSTLSGGQLNLFPTVSEITLTADYI